MQIDIASVSISALIGAIVVALGWSLILGRKFQIIDDLKEDFKEIRQDIRSLLERMTKLEGTFSGAVGKGSPLAPTELGAKYIKESGLEKFLSDKKPVLNELIKKLLPKDSTEYDAQEAARRVMTSLKDDPAMNPIKEYSFKNGVELEVILGAGALWLRDDFLGLERRIASKKDKNGQI